MIRRMRSKARPAAAIAVNATIVFGLLAATALAAHADEALSGLPEASIATSLPPELGDPGGVRRALAASGITVGANYIGEYFGVASGGLNRVGHYDGRLELFLDADLEKTIGWKGLTFHVNAFQLHGPSITVESVGSLMPVSSVEATPATRLFEIWLEQSLFDGLVSVRAGQLATDTEFMLSDGAAAFINATWGWPAIAAANLPNGGPAYPMSAPAIRLAITPNDNFGVMAAVFNGDVVDHCGPDQDPQRCNAHGLDFPFGDGALIMAEGFYKYNQGEGQLPGTLKVGGWFHTGDFENLANPAIEESNNHGIYAIWDQMLMRLEGEGRNIALFARMIGAPDDVNEIDIYAEGGLTVTGPFANRKDDLFGFAFAYTGISDGAKLLDRLDGLNVVRDYEALLEVSYTANIVPGFVIQPDLQYFWNPGGKVTKASGEVVDHALVAGVRSVINY